MTKVKLFKGYYDFMDVCNDLVTAQLFTKFVRNAISTCPNTSYLFEEDFVNSMNIKYEYIGPVIEKLCELNVIRYENDVATINPDVCFIGSESDRKTSIEAWKNND